MFYQFPRNVLLPTTSCRNPSFDQTAKVRGRGPYIYYFIYFSKFCDLLLSSWRVFFICMPSLRLIDFLHFHFSIESQIVDTMLPDSRSNLASRFEFSPVYVIDNDID